MRIRHKVPAIFSLSMVDMLCCALGCVILVWLLNAKQSEDDANERLEELSALRQQADAERLEGQTLLSKARTEYEQASKQLTQLLDERAKAATEAAALKGRIGELEKVKSNLEKARMGLLADTAEIKSQLRETEAKLADRMRELKEAVARAETRGKSLAESEKMTGTLQADIRSLTKKYETERARAEGLAGQLSRKERDLSATVKLLETATSARTGLEKTLVSRDAKIKELEGYRERHAEVVKRAEDLEARLKARIADLDEAQRQIVALERGGKESTAKVAALEKEKKVALDKVATALAQVEKERTALRQAAENRFAGITLKGRKVVFLVDISGSMTMLDSKTDAPQKWKEVCTTVGKLLRSMPDVEQYQVITFAKEVDFPLGGNGRWLRYNPATTPENVTRALRGITPSGGTNMYAAMETAFGYRNLGMDTIYLLSDGLPNQGEGLTAIDRSTLGELQRSQKLGRYILSKLKASWNRPLKGSPRVSINTIGFFYESPDLGAFLWALARDNEGSFVGMSTP